ncbi:zinc ABC transporter substrate-binding protein [Mangrovicoccus algicola]|uniref:High-affinity zinc uptake system protein ZnuA n=1 Tax=Mangrovicoccus algicola TaxID=2771008 RepID=A0A8J7CWL6_9RHOB|nr:zinc ABC transporter substrate-binding protein [Mangrovicoccus algicola]MBE3637917.1 zinc ABC transporter substrate-binding protein [Mangrovicoccus algicola]
MRMISKMLAAGILAGAATTARAEIPHVVTDIPPVHGLVARVMQGLGTPDLVIPPGSSPHGYALRPSEAAGLARAGLVVWVGESLTPWLEQPLDRLAGDAAHLELMAVPGTHLLEFREGATFEPHSHEGEGGHDHDHDHAHDDHDHDHAEHDHHHEGADPHAWLDPQNGALWLDAIAAELSRLDPEHAAEYAANAAAGREEIATAAAEAQARLTPVQGRPFVVFHDAYHYFEAAFGLEAAGAISMGDASDPGPARVEEVRDLVRETGAVCAFSEPEFSDRLVDTVIEGSAANKAHLDPLGADLETGPGFYPALIGSLAAAMAGCLG